MAVNIHLVRVGLFTIDQNGQKIDKRAPTTTIGALQNTSQEFLVIPDSAVPNSANYPRVTDYIKAEAQSGYVVYHFDQSYIITYDQATLV